MGFHKRFLNIEIVHRSLKENKIFNLFTKADAIIFDDEESSKAYSLFLDGKSNDEILQYIEKLKTTNNENN